MPKSWPIISLNVPTTSVDATMRTMNAPITHGSNHRVRTRSNGLSCPVSMGFVS